MTSAGRFVPAMTLAIVNVLPDPVTPSRTCRDMPWERPATSSRIASGWSPEGDNGDFRRNRFSTARSSSTHYTVTRRRDLLRSFAKQAIRAFAASQGAARLRSAWSTTKGERGARMRRLRLVLPGGAGLGVLEDDAQCVELLADPVGFGEVLPGAGGLARLYPAEDLLFR